MYRKKLIVTFIAVVACTIVDAQSQQDIEAMSKAAVQKQVVSGYKVKEACNERDVKAVVLQKREAKISTFEMLKSAIKWKRSDVEDKMRRIDWYLKDLGWHGNFISGLTDRWRMVLSDIKEPTTDEEAREICNDVCGVEGEASFVLDWLRTNKAKRDEDKSLGKIDTPITEDEFAKAFTTKIILDLARSYFNLEEWEKGIAELEKVLSWDPGNAEARQLKIAAESHLVPTAKAEREVRERERRAKWRKEGEEFTINDPYGLYMTMKWCPAGTFTMGSPPTEEGHYDDERQHEVTLTKGFWMGQTEVTQGQWKKLMGGETIADLARKALQDDTVYNIGGKQQTLRELWGLSRDADPMRRCGDLKDNVPVYNVSWNEAIEFCRRLTQRERAEGRIPDGYEYRLPTEVEWEYACRAGTTSALPNGRDIRILGKNNAPALDDIAWYGGNSSVGFEGIGWDTVNWPEKQYPGGRACACGVKGKQPNRWGLYDMIGNVWEWCSDWYGDYPYGSATDPTGAATGAYRVFRGGSWDCYARYCRSAYRFRRVPGFRSNDLGFRVALAPSH